MHSAQMDGPDEFQNDDVVSAVPSDILFGESAEAQQLAARLEVVSATDLPVVLEGEAGTGKEAAARWIHRLSPFAKGGFVKVACMGPDEADTSSGEHMFSLEQQTFYTRLAQAGSGTLFLDDAENLPAACQALLMQMMQEQENGNLQAGQQRLPFRFRIISATRGELKEAMEQELLRPDFFHRISTFSARLLPLRERLLELPRLAAYFIDRHSQEYGLTPPPLSRMAWREMEQYRWPGNFRELDEMMISYVLTGSEENLVQKLRVLSRSVALEDAGLELVELPPAMPEKRRRRARKNRPVVDDETLLRALRENCWNRRQTAGLLKMSYRSLLNRLKKIDEASRNTRPQHG